MLTDSFERELIQLLNKHSIDSQCNISDFILGRHIYEYLDSLQKMNRAVEVWKGNDENTKDTKID